MALGGSALPALCGTGVCALEQIACLFADAESLPFGGNEANNPTLECVFEMAATAIKAMCIHDRKIVIHDRKIFVCHYQPYTVCGRAVAGLADQGAGWGVSDSGFDTGNSGTDAGPQLFGPGCRFLDAGEGDARYASGLLNAATPWLPTAWPICLPDGGMHRPHRFSGLSTGSPA